MDLHQDFADLCALLNERRVDYLIVGGYAVAFHGAPRFTGDLDLLVAPEIDNVGRMLKAVREFGFPADVDAAGYLISRKTILQLGRIPRQIHLMTSISGVSWEDAWASRKHGSYMGVPVVFIGRSALLENKRIAARAKDLADLAALQRKPPDAG